jgi:general secretion pathway protein F
MASFQYRAVDAAGRHSSGNVVALDRSKAIAEIRRAGSIPIDIVEARADRATAPRAGGKLHAQVRRLIGELAVLLDAGLPLDRALALAIDNLESAAARSSFASMLVEVREGRSLSQAMASRPELFSPTAQAMAEAGEMNGRLAEALARLAAALESAEELRRLVATSMIYPAMLLILAVGVILMMLLYVVPQFETLFATAGGKLPQSSLAIMAASSALRDHGLLILGSMVLLGLLLRQLGRQPGARALFDRTVLQVPMIGTLVRHFETARFSRTLGVLLEGDVPLPTALKLSRRSISNRTMGALVDKVAEGLKEGEGLSLPLGATGMFPKAAVALLRTGEETSRLPSMLGRLADIMDKDVKVRIERAIAIVTPLITIILGASVAGIIASIMTALLGFNDLAVSQ